MCVTLCVYVQACEHVCSLCLSISPGVHDVHTNEGLGYTPLLSGLCVSASMCVCVCLYLDECLSAKSDKDRQGGQH